MVGDVGCGFAGTAVVGVGIGVGELALVADLSGISTTR